LSLSFWPSHQNPACIPLLSHACCMPCPSYPTWLDHYNNILRRFEVIKLLITRFSQRPDVSSLLGPNILLSTLFSNTTILYYSPSVRDQVSHPYKTTGKIIVLHIAFFKF
jgi:hypothetical protein